VLQAIDRIREPRPPGHDAVGVCGEMAGDPAAALLLLGMGVDSMSMAASSLPRVKWVVRSFTRAHARAILDQVLEPGGGDGRAGRGPRGRSRTPGSATSIRPLKPAA